jgi:hypothetical protein
LKVANKTQLCKSIGHKGREKHFFTTAAQRKSLKYEVPAGLCASVVNPGFPSFGCGSALLGLGGEIGLSFTPGVP